MDTKTDASRFPRRAGRSPSVGRTTSSQALGARRGIRVGVDVGNQFTYVVAWDEVAERLVARTRVPTGSGRHQLPLSIDRALRSVLETVSAAESEAFRLVAYSTTRPLGDLLQGDSAPVGVLVIRRKGIMGWMTARAAGIRSPRVAPGRSLTLIREHLEVEGDPDEFKIKEIIYLLLLQGAKSICVSAGPDVGDRRHPELVMSTAAELGVPASIALEELGTGRRARNQAAALTAGMAPVAARTTDAVEVVIHDLLPEIPVFRVGGDGIATSAASARAGGVDNVVGGVASPVIGVLRGGSVSNAIVVDIGATTTKVCRLFDGLARLSSVEILDSSGIPGVASHVTGVGGGSLMRFSRWRRRRIVGVGPRSAASAQLLYCAFASPELIAGARVALTAPIPGDPARYPVLDSQSGPRLALTLTCAATALGKIPETFYASLHRDSAVLGFEILAEALGVDWRYVVRYMLEAGTQQIESLVMEAMSQPRVGRPYLLGVGGAAALLPMVAGRMGLPWLVPSDAELMSSLGAALSASVVAGERDKTNVPGVVEMPGRS